VETPDFLKVLQHYPETSLAEAEAVLTLKENYPFSQLLRTLSARVSKDHELGNSKNELQLAAVYSADRAVLKEIMEAVEAQTNHQRFQPAALKSNTIPSDVAHTVMEDLAKLTQLKQNFELLFVDGPISQQIAPPIPTPVAESTVFEATAVKESESDASAIKSRKERIIQLAKTFTAPVESTVIEVEPGFKSRRRKRDAMDNFIDQIAVNNKELTPESEKHKEQIEMIDHFIRIQPSISGVKDKPAQNSDLSTIKTGEFGDHIISETLVEILLKQGKKEKAIEVLKKLIWKFPQKKTYFAAQIEELRK
jgi:hypothetical protein